ncbi:LPS export ABC transporter permease LptF [Pelagivirga sediminicola]|uniref:LPS export ABC transporter permease LptF n=1 Tax=Pelagivirga sediminicola TaxID=2170575 RepID=A0A2T7GAQ4_9RHOB|nr:LPS export ABC transporter permease LptF [Pelagivirga sediminicola]PVA11468.1 LPS export ABC transporter permease LptF [Pelagivirga sediminicola]
MLSQFMVLFGFFALVLVSIFWINKAVRMFDRLISDGQSSWIVIEFTALTLPGVIGLVLPIAAFAGSVYVTNRLSTESELTVMQATGFSPWRLARPVLYYGVIVALMMSLLLHVLIPLSLKQLEQRRSEVSGNITAKLLTEGEFLHPASGVTFYIRQITPQGELRNVFLSDRRRGDGPTTYTSSKAYLVQEGGSTKLVMLNGLAQNVAADGQRLFTTHFDDFSYDISRLVAQNALNLDRIAFASTPDLLRDPAAVAERTGVTLGAALTTLHSRFAQAILCIVAALVGFATLLLGGYSRFGVWRQIITAFVLLIGVKLIESAVAGPVLDAPMMWPLLYLPSAVGLLLSAGLLYAAAHPGLLRRLRRRDRAEALS